MRTFLVLLAMISISVGRGDAEGRTDTPPSRAEIEHAMDLRSEGDVVRGQMDTLGFVVTSDQAEDVVSTALDLERDTILERDRILGTSPESGFLGGVCPHDDHLYASRAYVHLTERISAPRIILIGVFHAARLWDLQDVVVFDDFEKWHGPWGPVPVDDLRGQLQEQMNPGTFIVDNSMHSREHSLEAIIPFLQHKNREVSIVPVLVPYVGWDRLSELAADFSESLAQIMQKNDWVLGRDVAIVVSSDAVHYGPDFGHAPFGTGAAAYQKGVDRDVTLAKQHLEGALDALEFEALLTTLVDPEDPRTYRLPWCGRFSVPFGLEVLRQVAGMLGMNDPEGHLLRYATSISEPELPVTLATKEAGLGLTAPSNLHHWVGYVTVGVTAGKKVVQP